MNLNGSSSSFYTSNILNDWQSRASGDVITPTEWNQLGDGIIALEKKLLDLAEEQRQNTLHPGSFFWSGTFTANFVLDKPYQLSAVSKIILPESVSESLGTSRPLGPDSLVKVQLVSDNPDLAERINSTSAIRCPADSVNPDRRLSDDDPIWRTIEVGIYCDGLEVPQDINNRGIKLHVFIMAPDAAL